MNNLYSIGRDDFGRPEDSGGGSALNMDWLTRMDTEGLILGGEEGRSGSF